jgi:hypothetical protein
MTIVTSLMLPAEFSDLEVWCDKWCLPNFKDRNDRRYETPFGEIRAFYTCMICRADDALNYLSKFQLGELDLYQENLLRLMLALAEIGPAVEWFGESQVPDGYDPQKIPLVVHIPENYPQ